MKRTLMVLMLVTILTALVAAPAGAARKQDGRPDGGSLSAELGIEPSLIASKSTLMALAAPEGAETAGLMRWQRELLGL